jgi:hypothetical protein
LERITRKYGGTSVLLLILLRIRNVSAKRFIEN